MLRKGLVRRIGDGSMTNIWRDRWLPNHFSGLPITTPANRQVQLVADLMLPSGSWNEELIKQTFFNVDAHAILSTPIRGAGADTWSWELERHGLYSVKSAYRKLYDEQCQQMSESNASSSEENIWKRIWGMCVSLKVRVFWWRVINGYLPTRGILHGRHIEHTPNCEVCGADE